MYIQFFLFSFGFYFFFFLEKTWSDVRGSSHANKLFAASAVLTIAADSDDERRCITRGVSLLFAQSLFTDLSDHATLRSSIYGPFMNVSKAKKNGPKYVVDSAIIDHVTKLIKTEKNLKNIGVLKSAKSFINSLIKIKNGNIDNTATSSANKDMDLDDIDDEMDDLSAVDMFRPPAAKRQRLNDSSVHNISRSNDRNHNKKQCDDDNAVDDESDEVQLPFLEDNTDLEDNIDVEDNNEMVDVHGLDAMESEKEVNIQRDISPINDKTTTPLTEKRLIDPSKTYPVKTMLDNKNKKTPSFKTTNNKKIVNKPPSKSLNELNISTMTAFGDVVGSKVFTELMDSIERLLQCHMSIAAKREAVSDAAVLIDGFIEDFERKEMKKLNDKKN